MKRTIIVTIVCLWLAVAALCTVVAIMVAIYNHTSEEPPPEPGELVVNSELTIYADGDNSYETTFQSTRLNFTGDNGLEAVIDFGGKEITYSGDLPVA